MLHSSTHPNFLVSLTPERILFLLFSPFKHSTALNLLLQSANNVSPTGLCPSPLPPLPDFPPHDNLRPRLLPAPLCGVPAFTLIMENQGRLISPTSNKPRRSPASVLQAANCVEIVCICSDSAFIDSLTPIVQK